MNRFLALIAAVAVVALVAVGCGSSDDSTTDSGESLTKAEFVKQGNAVCTEGNKEIEEGFEEFSKEHKPKGEPSEAEFEEVAEDVLIPAVDGQIEGLRALGTPEGDEGEVDEILTGAEEAIAEIEEDPSLLSEQNGGPFAEVNREARAYGLTVCGEEG